jgi:hypothetical protein
MKEEQFTRWYNFLEILQSELALAMALSECPNLA